MDTRAQQTKAPIKYALEFMCIAKSSQFALIDVKFVYSCYYSHSLFLFFDTIELLLLK